MRTGSLVCVQLNFYEARSGYSQNTPVELLLETPARPIRSALKAELQMQCGSRRGGSAIQTDSIASKQSQRQLFQPPTPDLFTDVSGSILIITGYFCNILRLNCTALQSRTSRSIPIMQLCSTANRCNFIFNSLTAQLMEMSLYLVV
jgi:hypothetical protein